MANQTQILNELVKDLNAFSNEKILQLMAHGGKLFAACDGGEGDLASLAVSIGIGPHDLLEQDVRARHDFYAEREIHPATDSMSVQEVKAALLADLELLAEELEGAIEDGESKSGDEQ
jgi:hypothetical protein